MMYKFISLFFIAFLIFTCSEKPTEPPEEDKLCEITDITNHDFVFETDTLGIFPSALYDVAAINQNNVWAVGEIELNTGRYNAIKWNGTEYEYHRIYYNTGIPRIDVLLAFDLNDIWMFAGDRFHYLDGDTFFSGNLKPGEAKGSTRAAWGISTDNYFLVGDNGSITHYNGTSFNLMESGTDVHLHDISGYIDSQSGITHAWAAGASTLLYFNGFEWQTVWDKDNPLFPDGYNFPGALYSPDPKHLLIAAYKPIDIRGYCISTNDPPNNRLLFTTDFFTYAMAGNDINDIFIVGSANSVAHFNGKSLKKFSEVNSWSNRSVSFKNDNVYIVGPISEQLGLFVKGKRQVTKFYFK